MKFASFLKDIKPSASMQIGLQSDSNNLINFAIGVSDLLPPSEISSLIAHENQLNRFPYISSKGTFKALSNIKELLFKSEKVDPMENLMLVNGAKWGIALALNTISDPGDIVILMEPYWLSYPDICVINRLTSVNWLPSSLEDGNLEFSIDDLEALLKKYPGATVILNNPNNPSGKVFDKTFVSSVSDLCKTYNSFLLIDEVYKDLVFDPDEKKGCFELNDTHVIRVGSFSKSLSVPGLRIGYIKGSSEFIGKANLINQHLQTCINSVSHAVISGINHSTYTDFIEKAAEIYRLRYTSVLNILDGSSFNLLKSDASFYLLTDVGHDLSGETICDILSREDKILCTPGSNYGKSFNNYIRICLVQPEQVLETAIEKIKKRFT